MRRSVPVTKFFIKARSHTTRTYDPEYLTVSWQSLLVIGLVIAAILVAGCTDDDVTVPELPPSDVVLPGQTMEVTGFVTGNGIAGGTIDTITFTVALVPGAQAVNMEKITIVYADTIKTETLIPVEGYHGNPPQGCWGILNVIDEVGASNNRLEDKEQFVIQINPRVYLPANRMATIVVRPPSGTPLTFRRVAPSTILASGNVLSVM
jgi:archaellin